MKFLRLGSIIILLFLFSIQSISVMANPSVIITKYEFSPSIFFPGDTGTLTITVKNMESINTISSTDTSGSTTTVITKTEGVQIKEIWIQPAYQNDKKISATTKYVDVGYLAPGAAIDINFQIKVDGDITEGTYYPIACIDIERYIDLQYPIEVKVSQASVDMIPLVVPNTLSLCGATDISFLVVNNREAAVSNIRISPRVSNGIDVRPKQMVINHLNGGCSQNVSFSLIPSEIGKMNIMFDIFYKNGGNEHTASSEVTIDVIDTLDVAPIIYNIPSTIELGPKRSIQLKIFNSKTKDISSVIITPISNARIFPSQYFIGSMDADDVYSVSFDIDTAGLTLNQTYTIGFSVSFKQDGYTFTTPAVMSAFTVVSNYGNSQESTIAIGGFLVIILVGGFLIVRWRKKHRIKNIVSKQK